LADADTLTALNERIEHGEIKNRAGKTIEIKVDGGLVRGDLAPRL
jgi:hypothetical protein